MLYKLFMLFTYTAYKGEKVYLLLYKGLNAVHTVHTAGIKPSLTPKLEGETMDNSFVKYTFSLTYTIQIYATYFCT